MGARMQLDGALEAGAGIEPTYGDLQSPAWPLCHPAGNALNGRLAQYRLPKGAHICRQGPQGQAEFWRRAGGNRAPSALCFRTSPRI